MFAALIYIIQGINVRTSPKDVTDTKLQSMVDALTSRTMTCSF